MRRASPASSRAARSAPAQRLQRGGGRVEGGPFRREPLREAGIGGSVCQAVGKRRVRRSFCFAAQRLPLADRHYPGGFGGGPFFPKLGRFALAGEEPLFGGMAARLRLADIACERFVGGAFFC